MGYWGQRFTREGAWVGLFVSALLLPKSAEALWAKSTDDVPIQTILESMQRHIQDNPKDWQGYYVLGRVHSMAFASGGDKVEVSGRQDLPEFAPYQTVREPRADRDKPLSSERLIHLESSLTNYAKAVELAKPVVPKLPADKAENEPEEAVPEEAVKEERPREIPPRQARRKQALATLGLAWMYEQAAGEKKAIQAAMATDAIANLEKPIRERLQAFVAGADTWEGKSVAAYRQAIELTAPSDTKKQHGGPEEDSLISLDAAKSIVRILEPRNRTVEEDRYLAEASKYVKTFPVHSIAVTPIIFRLDAPLPLAAHLDKDASVNFDLVGDGIARRWPWLARESYLLTWDPERKGQITSGRQLFGSVTWWIFWDHGYQPLAALDNNGDGYLTDRELLGLAGWRDANSNGVADPGEVTPVESLGIVRIATRPDGGTEGTPSCRYGLQTSDGRTLPTFDWKPSSLPVEK
ncbi:MAG: hypothetical protein K8T91_09830 [Planctomycetes bacterium]|nr:hypothetical protein [Planctomycetota bacterium]